MLQEIIQTLAKNFRLINYTAGALKKSPYLPFSIHLIYSCFPLTIGTHAVSNVFLLILPMYVQAHKDSDAASIQQGSYTGTTFLLRAPYFIVASISALGAIRPGKGGRNNKPIKTVFYMSVILLIISDALCSRSIHTVKRMTNLIHMLFIILWLLNFLKLFLLLCFQKQQWAKFNYSICTNHFFILLQRTFWFIYWPKETVAAFKPSLLKKISLYTNHSTWLYVYSKCNELT